MNSIAFHGAAQTVTGSRHLIQTGGKSILVDCGMFQGATAIRERNWLPFPVEPQDIDAVVLTHAHLDHAGWLPRLVSQGYSGPIYATPATTGLCRISLPDSGRLQEEDARYANKHRTSRHVPALPLYDEKQAFACLKQFVPVPYGELHKFPGGAQWRFLPAGHILGSAFAEIYFDNGERILMSGDLGRFNTPLIRDPSVVDFTEHLVIESTYGNRVHSAEDPEEKLASVIYQAHERGGCVIVPSFAIGRTQELLFYLRRLQDREMIPRTPIYIDSPMASSTTALYAQHPEEHGDVSSEVLRHLEPNNVRFVRDRNESKALNSLSGPFFVIAGSGMANGGRITHHLLNRLGDPRHVVLFTGYQAEGTLGRDILERKPVVNVLGQDVEVKAQVERLNALSAHADSQEMLHWLRSFKTPPKATFLVHGEPDAQEALRALIVDQLGWNVVIPHQSQRFVLS
jgi:metallo-beta-lactamase family protein